MAFSPANVDVHRSSVALEFGDPVAALDAGRRVDPALLAAEQISPEVMRADLAVVQKLARTLLRRERGHALTGLRALATRLGVAD
jgi:hypothetical protein